MKKVQKSVLVPLVMGAYALVFFVYQFAVRHVGFSPRNIAVLAGAIIMILAAWLINREIEKGKRKQNPADQPNNETLNDNTK